MRRVTVLVVLLAVGSLTLAVAAYQQPPLQSHRGQLRDNLFMLKRRRRQHRRVRRRQRRRRRRHEKSGMGTADSRQIGLADRPVTMIINTHTHGDHVSGNVEFPAAVTSITQENRSEHGEGKLGRSCATAAPPNIFRQTTARAAKRAFETGDSRPGSGEDRLLLRTARTNAATRMVSFGLRLMHTNDSFQGRTFPSSTQTTAGAAL